MTGNGRVYPVDSVALRQEPAPLGVVFSAPQSHHSNWLHLVLAMQKAGAWGVTEALQSQGAVVGGERVNPLLGVLSAGAVSN